MADHLFSAWTHGPCFGPDGFTFRLWAPYEPQVDLLVEGGRAPSRMHRDQSGFHALQLEDLRPGARYRFRLSSGRLIPDPASRFQPLGVEGPSELVELAAGDRPDRAGISWDDMVLYEFSVDAFTPEGTFAGALKRLDHLAELGVTGLQLMPINAFAGQRNWGYDRVLPYATAASYGRPEEFRALVDAAHARNLAVLLDVVYDHFGPEGNYLPLYAPDFFTLRHRTPWGAAINFDGPDSGPVRAFFVENALYWINTFQLDGLRLDAVHSIRDDSKPDILEELAAQIRSRVDRPVHLMVENDENERGGEAVVLGEQAVRVNWRSDSTQLVLDANLSESSERFPDPAGEVFWARGDIDAACGPWSVRWSFGAP